MYEMLSKGSDPDYIIIQQKYATKRAHINEKYSFLLRKNYKILSIYRNINFYEEYYLGWDGFVLLQKK